MKIDVDWDLCDGNGVCAIEAPGVFEMDDDDELHVLKEDIEEEERPQVDAAIRVCPKRALSLHP
ncbi:ferredoxin [Actinoplanes lutulentus]|uniref:Ferredoxin n=2 Tax=Actinoplanes lutulentus TaxID=1287878 RepID=A0A327Z1G9_9ACTN|nr:ferredoxin [Actinoplanes lutulentus]